METKPDTVTKPTCKEEYGKHEWTRHEETGVEYCTHCKLRKDKWEPSTALNNADKKLDKVPEQLRDHVIKPGEVRNPNGRPKGSRNLTTIVMEALRSKVLTVKLPDGTTTQMTGEQAFAEAVLENALKKKDRESIRMLWEMSDGKPTQQHKLEVSGPKGYEISPEAEQKMQEQFGMYPDRIGVVPKIAPATVVGPKDDTVRVKMPKLTPVKPQATHTTNGPDTTQPTK